MTLGNNKHGRWTRLIGEANRLVQAARQLDRQGLPWEPWELDALRELYPVLTNPELAELFGRSQGAVKRAGLTISVRRKFPEVADRAAREAQASPGTRATQFRKGNVPHDWKPIGTEVVNSYGYRRRKVRDGCKPAVYNWEFVHILEWERHNGPVPAGHKVVFRDGDKTNTDIENLELVSNAEMMRRNTLHRYGPEIAGVIQLKGVLIRKINHQRKKRNEERH